MLVPLLSYRSLSQEPGIYLFLDSKGEVLYVGKAKNLKQRVSSYFIGIKDIGPKTRILISKTKKIKTISVPSEIEALILEANYIKKLKPKYNARLTDGKAYPLIRITIKDKYPKILIARRVDDATSVYFGPYPNSGALKLVLRFIRRIFPYISVKNHPKKKCLYYHLGLCPCLPTSNYRKNIRRIISFLSGGTKKVIRDLKKERDYYSRALEFEKAGLLQNKIDSIILITDPYYKGGFENVNPNLTEDLEKKEIIELKTILQKNSLKVESLKRIECFDISNTSGTNATGSMVVFTNGAKDGSWYRKFKIRRENTPNDFAMISEVLQRRIQHKEWPFPDLIIVDGGKGQVSAALEAMKQFNNLTIPVIGLAKREEIIITSELKEIVLPKESKALKLVMRIRDEAHRFAITYHRLLRSKTFLH